MMLLLHKFKTKRITNGLDTYKGNSLGRYMSTLLRYIPNAELNNLTVMIFGSSTDVGKTIISAGLSIAALKHKHKVCYIKPIQTGNMDEYFMQLYTNPLGNNPDIYYRTLSHYKHELSPHIAASLDSNGEKDTKKKVVTDQELLNDLLREINAFKTSVIVSNPINNVVDQHNQLFTVVETAGGVLSPGPNKTLQADMYRPLRLPVLLVGDAKLGGISTTLSAYESLRIRGYSVLAIVMIDQPNSNMTGNAEYINEHLQSYYTSSSSNLDLKEEGALVGKKLGSIGSAPKIISLTSLPSQRSQLLHSWFKENENSFSNLFHYFKEYINIEYQEYADMYVEGQKSIWWPFTQHSHISMLQQQEINNSGNTNNSNSNAIEENYLSSHEVTFIESAHKDYYRIINMTNSSTNSVNNNNNNNIINNSNNIKASSIVDMFDGCASWWTQSIGHGHPAMSLAIAAACGRYGHVMFPRNLHPPAVLLARFLLSTRGPGNSWAQRVFYSDDGSTAMEIALKMAFRLAEKREIIPRSDIETATSPPTNNQEEVIGIENRRINIIILSQDGGYHGDTLGTMNTSTPNVFNHGQHPWYQCQAIGLAVPTFAYVKGVFSIDASSLGNAAINSEISKHLLTIDSLNRFLDVDKRIHTKLADEYRTHITKILDININEHQKIGSLLIEPLMLGAGGLKFIDPLFQKILIQECRLHHIPIVFDEVAVGFYRLGYISTTSILQEYPDIAAYGKMLTGGYLPLAVTLASEETFNAFLSYKPTTTNCHNNNSNNNSVSSNSNNNNHNTSTTSALLHGHSFTANPIACSAALEGIRLIENSFIQQGGNKDQPLVIAPSFTEQEMKDLSLLAGVKSVMSLGSVLSIELIQSASNRMVMNHTHVHEVITYKEDDHTYHPLSIDKYTTTTTTSGNNTNNSCDTSTTNTSIGINSNAINLVSLLRKERIYARPIGNTVYLMPTPLTSITDQQRLIRVMKRCLTKLLYIRSQSNNLNNIQSTNSNVIV